MDFGIDGHIWFMAFIKIFFCILFCHFILKFFLFCNFRQRSGSLVQKKVTWSTVFFRASVLLTASNDLGYVILMASLLKKKHYWIRAGKKSNLACVGRNCNSKILHDELKFTCLKIYWPTLCIQQFILFLAIKWLHFCSLQSLCFQTEHFTNKM